MHVRKMLVSFSFLVLACDTAGCDVKTAIAEAAYADEQLLCVDIAQSREEADRCRDMVRARWCGEGEQLFDAGACTYYDAGTLARDVLIPQLDAPSEVNTWAPDALTDGEK